MARKKSAEKERRWREVLKRWGQSGLSVRRLCALEEISEPSFYAWRRWLAERKNGKRRRKAGHLKDNRGRLFVPLHVVDATPTLEIIHPLGCRIHVTGDVDPVALGRVIEALDQRGTP